MEYYEACQKFSLLLEDLNKDVSKIKELRDVYVSEDVNDWIFNIREDNDSPNLGDMAKAIEDNNAATEIDFSPSDFEDVEEAINYIIDQAQKNKNFNLSYGPAFPEERTIIPLKRGEVEVDDLEVPSDIVDAVDIKGYRILNYRKGLAEKKDGDRTIKIGKLLNKNPQLKKKFDERLKGKKIDTQKMSMVFSWKPRDIATMSTDRGWTSCSDLRSVGPAANQLPNKIRYGGMVVYLINAKDKDIKHPVARIAIRRLIDRDDGSFALLPEKRCYGAPVDGFADQVKEVLDKNNKVTLKKDFSIISDFERGYSDTFQHLKIVTIKGKKLSDLSGEELIKAAKGISGDSIQKASKDLVNKLLNALAKKIGMNEEDPMNLMVEVMYALNSQGALKKYPGILIGWINDMFNYRRGHVEEYYKAIEEYISYLMKEIPEDMKRIFSKDDNGYAEWKSYVDLRTMSGQLFSIIKKHIPEMSMDVELANQIVGKGLEEIYENLNTANFKDVKKRIDDMASLSKQATDDYDELYELTQSGPHPQHLYDLNGLALITLQNIFKTFEFVPYFIKIRPYDNILNALVEDDNVYLLKSMMYGKTTKDFRNILQKYLENSGDNPIKFWFNTIRSKLNEIGLWLYKVGGSENTKRVTTSAQISWKKVLVTMKYLYRLSPEKVKRELKTTRELQRDKIYSKKDMSIWLNTFDVIQDYLDDESIYPMSWDAEALERRILDQSK